MNPEAKDLDPKRFICERTYVDFGRVITGDEANACIRGGAALCGISGKTFYLEDKTPGDIYRRSATSNIWNKRKAKGFNKDRRFVVIPREVAIGNYSLSLFTLKEAIACRNNNGFESFHAMDFYGEEISISKEKSEKISQLNDYSSVALEETW